MSGTPDPRISLNSGKQNQDFVFLVLFYESSLVKVKISCIKILNPVLTQLNVKVQLEFTNQGTQSRKQN